jgi:Flp pilus assembly CpaF family ATPase
LLDAIGSATQHAVSVLYGATGTGKTTTAAAYTSEDARRTLPEWETDEDDFAPNMHIVTLQ